VIAQKFSVGVCPLSTKITSEIILVATKIVPQITIVRQLFEQEASGHFTELDSVPASIFEILFGEVI